MGLSHFLPKTARGEFLQRKQTSMQNSSLIYGRRAAALILRLQHQRIKKLNLQTGAKFDAELVELIAKVPQQKVAYVSKEELDLFSKDGVHQGILLELKESPEVPLDVLIKKSLSAQGRGLLLALDEVCDPHNLGAIFRVAEAFGVDGIISTERRSAALTEVAKKSSAGASEFVPFCTVSNLHRALEQLKKSGFWLVGTALKDDAQDVDQLDLDPPLVIVMGSEGKGLRELTIKSCDFLAKIPMRGVIESLNVSQATSIVLWEIAKKIK